MEVARSFSVLSGADVEISFFIVQLNISGDRATKIKMYWVNFAKSSLPHKDRHR